MWICSRCRETVDDAFDVCWNCGTPIDGESAQVAPEAPSALTCLRCSETIEHLGTKRFHEGANWGILGELGELFVKRERFDVYACPKCGKVEFFVDGVGEAFRPE